MYDTSKIPLFDLYKSIKKKNKTNAEFLLRNNNYEYINHSFDIFFIFRN